MEPNRNRKNLKNLWIRVPSPNLAFVNLTLDGSPLILIITKQNQKSNSYIDEFSMMFQSVCAFTCAECIYVSTFFLSQCYEPIIAYQGHY